MKNYSILFYTGGGSHPDPELRAGEGGQCQFFWAFRPRFGLRIRGEGQSAILPPGPSPWYATVFGLTVGEGYAVSVDYLIACDMIVYLIKVILTVNYYLFQVFKLNLQDPTIVQYAKGEFTASFPFHLSISSQIVEF